MISAARKAGVKRIKYFGFDFFEKSPDSPTSLNEIAELFTKFNVEYYLFNGDTRETLPREVQNLPKMDFIYIDGGHSYETCKSDWENAKRLMHDETVVVFDDIRYDGVSRVVDEIGNEFIIERTPRRAIVRRCRE